ncbi:histidine kinase [Amycolatopsis taiwanensis]|uniref:histidine kinase n=1 Tax=Amycolatopsis taiwanensis TaxID=342230 RepID=A0A9W6QXV7_9PSEU|nr:histidine kinase [Amycolatopsis taiwanensis]
MRSKQVRDRHSDVTEPQRRFRSIGTRLQVATVSIVALLIAMVVLGIAAVGLPSLKLMIIGQGVQQASVPAVPALAALQAERQQALAYLAAPNADLAALQQQEARTSQGLQEMQAAADSALSGAPAEIVDRLNAFVGLLGELPQQRSMIEARSATSAQVFNYYNTVLDAATRLFDAQARVVPDAPITQHAIAAVALFRVADEMSRAGSLAAGALADQSFSGQDYQQFQHLVGAYHTELDTTSQYVRPEVQTQYSSVVRGSAFRQLSTLEDALIARGPDPHKPAVSFPVTADEWSSVTSAVSQQLVDLTIKQANAIATEAADTGASQFWLTASILGALTVAAVAAAIVGIRLARSVSRRLGSLAQGVHRVATDEVPELVDRIHADHDIDIPAQVELLDDRHDEIGGVAVGFRDAVVADLEARKREILLREGTTRVLKELAHRIQIPVLRMLDTLYDAQQKEQNPRALRLLYTIDHEVIRARRTADHMIVLAGDQPRQQRRNPVPLYNILQGAATETSPPEASDAERQLERFKLQNIPTVSVKPLLAHQIAHLLSELMDNAVRYSPPQSVIRVSGMPTAHGVAIEIADAGPGLSEDRLASANALMRNPPEFDVMVREEAISQLGFFVVAHLARALGMKVAFSTSAFQGLSAIVILPEDLLAPVSEEPQDVPAPEAESPAAPATADSSWFRAENAAEDDADLTGNHANVTQLISAVAAPARPALVSTSGGKHSASPPPARVAAPTPEAPAAPNGLPPQLPKRRRGATLNQPDTTAVRVNVDTPSDDHAVETTRTQLSALQRGTERGRRAAEAEQSGSDQWPAWPREDGESR